MPPLFLGKRKNKDKRRKNSETSAPIIFQRLSFYFGVSFIRWKIILAAAAAISFPNGAY